jgi:hypothetical protein
MEERFQCKWTTQSFFHYGNYAQITSKQLHLLFVHDNNKSNDGQIEQVVPMGGNFFTQDFFLCLKIIY